VSRLSPRRIDYLIAVFKCSKGKGYARQREIIEELGIAKPTASLMIKKLKDEGYLEIRERKIFLDKKGEKMIEEALWKHGVLENAFVKLGLSSREACEVSWRVLDRVPSKIVEQIWRNIGMPDRCPCGYLLPTGSQEDILSFEVCKMSDGLGRGSSDRSKSD